VLKPGGRLCSSVWSSPNKIRDDDRHAGNRTEVVVAPSNPDEPNMFRCAAPGYVSALYEAAGLRDIASGTSKSNS